MVIIYLLSTLVRKVYKPLSYINKKLLVCQYKYVYDMKIIKSMLSVFSLKNKNSDILVSKMVKETNNWLEHVSAIKTSEGVTPTQHECINVIEKIVADKRLSPDLILSDEKMTKLMEIQKLRKI